MAQRRTDVDVVRFLALVSMYVAHVAPVPGPARVLELSEYLTMPLFALLVGVGAELGVRGAGTTRWWWSLAVRAGVLVGLGLLLERAGAQVVVVLVHLGVLLVVAGVLARRSPTVVGSVAVAVFVAVAVLAQAGSDLAAWAATAGDVTGEVVRFAWTDGPYRLLPMVLYAAIGILLARQWLHGPGGRSVLAPGLVGLGLLVPAAGMLAAEQAGVVDLVPYSGTVQETVLDALLAAGVLGVGLAASRAVARSRSGGVVTGMLAAAGAMTLSLYALQVLWLAYDARVLHPGSPDDTWANLAVLVLGSVLVAVGWRAVVRREPWQQGPIEGVVRAVAGRRK